MIWLFIIDVNKKLQNIGARKCLTGHVHLSTPPDRVKNPRPEMKWWAVVTSHYGEIKVQIWWLSPAHHPAPQIQTPTCQSPGPTAWAWKGYTYYTFTKWTCQRVTATVLAHTRFLWNALSPKRSATFLFKWFVLMSLKYLVVVWETKVEQEMKVHKPAKKDFFFTSFSLLTVVSK